VNNNRSAAEIEIRPYAAQDRDGVLAVVIPIQREEFGIAITADDQPDLAVIADFYQSGKGEFWVAVKDGRVVGTLGLKDIGNSQAALRKMFVASDFRGRDHGVASRLLSALFRHAAERGIVEIILGTTDRFLAAHRFYEKNGFVEIGAAELPASFPRMAVDSKFYRHRSAA
jgi:N-acetylglutamate synthase-like GNAT family acetyltransferase